MAPSTDGSTKVVQMYLGEPQPFEPQTSVEERGGNLYMAITMTLPLGYEAEGQRYLDTLTNAVLQRWGVSDARTP